MNINEIYCGNNIAVLKNFSDEVIDLIVTSCPYDSLRTYQTYSWDFERLAEQLYRVIKDGGVLVWVVGDGTEKKGSETLTSFKQAIHFKEQCGFRVHDTMIYEKGNFSNPSSNRYHQIFEYMFVFSKGKPKTFNPIKDKPNKMFGKTCFGENTVRQKDGSFKTRPKKIYNEFGMRTNIWKMKTAAQEAPCKKREHPAMFPLQLAEDQISSWSNPGELVLDPFVGSGQTCIAAKKLDRNYIGIDISPEYCELAKRRIKEA